MLPRLRSGTSRPRKPPRPKATPTCCSTPELRAAAATLRSELASLLASPGGERGAADPERRLTALAAEASEARDRGGSVAARRDLAEIEMRARLALVRLAVERGEPIQTSIRSTQLRSAASRLADADEPALARVGALFFAAAALGELRRDPAPTAEQAELAAERLGRLLHKTRPPEAEARSPEDRSVEANGLEAAAEAPPDTPVAQSATVALALLQGRSGQTRADSGIVRRAAAVVPRVAMPSDARAALARYAYRADLLDEPLNLASVLPGLAPPSAKGAGSQQADAAEGSRAGGDAAGPVTLVHYFQEGRSPSLRPLFALRELRQSWNEDELRIVSVSLGPVTRWPAEARWPARVSRAGSLGVDALAVEVVPTFAVFARDGGLRAVGESDAVLAIVRRLLARAAGQPVPAEAE